MCKSIIWWPSDKLIIFVKFVNSCSIYKSSNLSSTCLLIGLTISSWMYRGCINLGHILISVLLVATAVSLATPLFTPKLYLFTRISHIFDINFIYFDDRQIIAIYIRTSSVSYHLIGRKSNPIFSIVKIPYRMHSSLDTTSRICRICSDIIPAKQIHGVITQIFCMKSIIVSHISYRFPTGCNTSIISQHM